MDIEGLSVFYRVAKLGGIGAAARFLGVTQSAVSQRLARLAKSLDRSLYGRAGRRIVLTEDGRRLYDSCREAFEALEAAEAALEGRETSLLGTVRLASLSEAGKAHLLPRILDFRKRYPSVEFDVLYRLPYEMLGTLSRHEADFVLTNEAYRRPQIEAHPLLVEEVVCVGRGPARSLSWKDLEKLPWLGYGPEDPLWYELEKLAGKHGAVLPRPAVRVADIESVMRLAAQGAGCALVPDHALKLRPLKGLVMHRLPTRFSKELYLCRLKTVEMGRAAQAFWELCRA